MTICLNEAFRGHSEPEWYSLGKCSDKAKSNVTGQVRGVTDSKSGADMSEEGM